MSADIHALEIEFAKNPTLDACIPLCHAYLSQERFMEAMVVCKKGMKSAPGDPRGRSTLAQVYVAQGKMPKARQELTKLLEENPGYPRGLELMGRVLIEQGDKPGAIQHLQTALQADPSLEEAPAMLQQLGAPLPSAEPPPPPAAPASAPPPRPAGLPPMAASSAPPVAAASQAPPPMSAAAALGSAPSAPPPMQRMESSGPPPASTSELDVAGTWADPAGDKKLEHVNDFFAPDTLGFANDGSHIETAGPGRLTILGFVPKSTGSIKTTMIALLVLFVVVGGFIGYQVWNSRIVRQKNAIFGEVKDAIRDDIYYRYKEAMTQIEAIKELDSSDRLALGAEAYIWSVLALDHGEAGALEKAKAVLPAAREAASDQENKYLVAASAMVAYLEERYDEGIAEVAAILDRGGNDVLIQLENYRLRSKTMPDDKATRLAFREMVELKGDEIRALSYLGWHYYREDNYPLADGNFDVALKTNKNHIRSLIGVSLVDLDRGIGLDERQKGIEQNIKQVFALPEDELSQRDRALGYFARAQLRQWQGNSSEAQSDYEKAYEIDPENPLFDYRRGLQLLSQGDAQNAVEFLKKAAAKDPNNVKALTQLARAQTEARDFDAALSSLSRAKELTDNDKRLVLIEAELLNGQRRHQDARELYGSITKKDGSSVYAQSLIGISSTYRDTGDAAKAVQFMQDAMQKTSKVPKRTEAKMWEELGRGFEASRSRDQARGAYQTCIDTFNLYANCHCRLALILGRGAEATQAAKACVRVDPRGELASSVQRLLR
ncbi:MAG: tetratricopeptide repeat protein [Myxococcota bacterium]